MSSTTTTWTEEGRVPSYPRLEVDRVVDVAIVGAGLTGAVAAYYLASTGKSVVVCEKNTVGSGETAYTTAFLTQAHDTYLSELLNHFSEEEVAFSWQSQQAAIDEIEYIARNEHIECAFTRCNAYIFSETIRGERRLRAEYAVAKSLGFRVHMGRSQLGFFHRGYLCIENQAKYHPLKFVVGILNCAHALGVEIYEQTEIVSYDGKGPVTLRTGDGCTITAQKVIVATHNPNLYDPVVHLRVRPMQTYVIEAHIPARSILPQLYWDTHHPYYYFRVDTHDGYDRILVGGEDHRVGEDVDTALQFDQLEHYLHTLLPRAAYTIERRWSGQVIETVDGMPIIGWSVLNPSLFVCTGYAGNGMTFGVVAAMMARDAILGKVNQWNDVFSLKRFRTIWAYIRTSVHVALHYLAGFVNPR